MRLRITCLALVCGAVSAGAQPAAQPLPKPAPVRPEPTKPTPALPVKPIPAAPTKLAPAPVAIPARPVRLRMSPIFAKKLNTDRAKLKGFVDLHTHPMAHLAMGGKLMHGAPDVGIAMPAGAIWDSSGVGLSGATCNGASRDARSIEEALGSCYSTHGGHDLIKNKCGNHIRRKVLDEYENGNHAAKAHDEDHPPGYPSFTKWPKFDDIEHQQMWIDWIKRAKDGGLRVMVALSVNSMTLAKGLDGNQPYDDKTIGDQQVKEMKRMVARHKDWMEIAYSASDVRRIVAQDKLAIILGVELDDIGSFAWSKREPSRTEVKAEIDRLYREGVRYVFPVHVIDNYFGGTALYEQEFARASKFHFGNWPKITCATRADGITWRQDNGADLFKLIALGDAGGTIPTPTCANGVGHKNSRGLTPLGKFAIDEMMAHGMLIDVDHASQQFVDELITYAATERGGYPLISGHNGLRDMSRAAGTHEKTRTQAQYQAIVTSKGIAGIGFGNVSASEYIASVRTVLRAAPNLAINLGSDINGFNVMPRPEKCEGDQCVKYSADFPKSKLGTKEWDYNVDGVAHIGLFPDFLRKVELLGGADIVDKLFDGAEGFARTWEAAETVSRRTASLTRPTTFDTIIATVRVTDDDVRDGAQAWLAVQLASGDLAELEITNVAKGGGAANRVEIKLRGATSVTQVRGVKVRHHSNDCFACSRDYWNGSIDLEGNNGQAIMKTPTFRIGHETKTFAR